MWNYFSSLDCVRKLKWLHLIDELESSMAEFSKREDGDFVHPLRTTLAIEDDPHSSFFGMMPCYSKREDLLSCKILSVFPGNKDMPSHIVQMVIFDANTGDLISVMVRIILKNSSPVQELIQNTFCLFRMGKRSPSIEPQPHPLCQPVG